MVDTPWEQTPIGPGSLTPTESSEPFIYRAAFPEAYRDNHVQGDLHKRATERGELVSGLKKLLGIHDNRAFNKDEKADILSEIGKLRAEVRILAELNLRQKEELEKSLEELRSGSERLGRKDWVTYGIGLATTLVIMEFVPPLVLLPFAVKFVHALGHLLIPDA